MLCVMGMKNTICKCFKVAPPSLVPSPQAMLLVAPKLNGANLNTQLLKYFAKCQLDEQVHIVVVGGWCAYSHYVPISQGSEPTPQSV